MGGNFFGIGFGELLFLAVLALLIFGPKRLPEIGRAVGRFLREFCQATRGIDQEMREWMGLTEEHPAAPATPGDLPPPKEKEPLPEVGPSPPTRPG